MACTAVPIFTWPGELFMNSLIERFGLRALLMNSRAFALLAFDGSVAFLRIVGPPEIDRGVKPRDGTWPACAMYFVIWYRSSACAIARRWFTSEMFFTLTP